MGEDNRETKVLTKEEVRQKYNAIEVKDNGDGYYFVRTNDGNIFVPMIQDNSKENSNTDNNKKFFNNPFSKREQWRKDLPTMQELREENKTNISEETKINNNTTINNYNTAEKKSEGEEKAEESENVEHNEPLGDEQSIAEKFGGFLKNKLGRKKSWRKDLPTMDELRNKNGIKREEESDNDTKTPSPKPTPVTAVTPPTPEPSTTETDTTPTGKTPEELAQEEADRKQQEAEEKAALEEKKKAKIDELKIEIDKKKEHVKNGPHGYRKLIASNASFHIYSIIYGAFSWVPWLGIVYGIFVTAIYWTFLSLTGLYGFAPVVQAFRLLIGTSVAGFLYNTILSSLTALSAGLIIVLYPFILGVANWLTPYLLKKMHLTEKPGDTMNKIYEEGIPEKLKELDEEFSEKKKAIIEEYKWKPKTGKFGKTIGALKKPSMSKTVSFLLIVLIMWLGNFGLNVISVQNYPLLIAVFVFVIILFAMRILKASQFFAVILVLLINLLFFRLEELLQNIPLGQNAVIAPILTIIILSLFVFKLEYEWDTRLFLGILMGLVLLLSMPFMFSYVNSPYFAEQMEANAMATRIQIEQMSLGERAKMWFDYQTGLAKGEIVEAGIQEKTQQFIGLTILGVSPTQPEYRKGEPVTINMFYKSGSYTPIRLWSSCSIDNNRGIVSEQNKMLSGGANEGFISCVINDATEGMKKIDFISLYNFTSTVETTLKIMSNSFVQKLNRITASDSEKMDIEKYIGGTIPARTSSGPVTIAVSNTFAEGKLTYRMPMLADKNKLLPIKLTYQLAPLILPTEGSGKDVISSINTVTINSPKGLNYNCSFAKEPIKFSDDGPNRMVARISGKSIKLTSYTTFDCDVTIQEDYKDVFVPDEGFSVNTITLSIDYDYLMQRSSMVRIK